jgi:ribose-phosphate pyrophosphokinase
MQVNILPHGPGYSHVDVKFVFEKNEDIIELLLFCDAAKRIGKTLANLYMDYVPFSRQDRTNAKGESFSLFVFANLINSLAFENVHIMDPHSDVTPALIHNCRVSNQWDLMDGVIHAHTSGNFWLVSPDAGALKKTHKLAQLLNTTRLLGVIESSKIRDTSTGEITGNVVYMPTLFRIDETFVIVDDICDGGRTFIELAKELRKQDAQKIHLYVTHGFFTKGPNVFKGIIDQVIAVNDQSARFTQ